MTVNGPPDLVTLPTEFPATESLQLQSMGVEPEAWSNTVDIVVSFFAKGELASDPPASTTPTNGAWSTSAMTIEFGQRSDPLTDSEELTTESEYAR